MCNSSVAPGSSLVDWQWSSTFAVNQKVHGSKPVRGGRRTRLRNSLHFWLTGHGFHLDGNGPYLGDLALSKRTVQVARAAGTGCLRGSRNSPAQPNMAS